MSKLRPTKQIEHSILFIRGYKVMLDADLAKLYGVTVGRLNEAVKRNIERFPDDFMFQLTFQELRALRSQIAISKKGRGGRRYLPYAFTEHGAIMAANVLNTQRAIEVSVHVVRAFIRLREMIASNKELSRRLDELEKKYDSQFRVVFDAIRQLMMPSVFTRPPRGCQDSLFSRCLRATGSDSAGKNRSDKSPGGDGHSIKL